jgi:hypothetical protein
MFWSQSWHHYRALPLLTDHQLPPLALEANARPTIPRIASIEEDDASLIECRLDSRQLRRVNLIAPSGW